MYSRITGTGSYLPEKILTNADLERMVDTSDEWIRTRTGITQRHIAREDQVASDLALHTSMIDRRISSGKTCNGKSVVNGVSSSMPCESAMLRMVSSALFQSLPC